MGITMSFGKYIISSSLKSIRSIIFPSIGILVNFAMNLMLGNVFSRSFTNQRGLAIILLLLFFFCYIKIF